MDGFDIQVTTDRDRYGPGETVVVTTQVCRTAASDTMTSSSGGSAVLINFQILDAAGAVVADDSHAIRTAELRGAPWAPGQCRTVSVEWDQRRWNQGSPPLPGADLGLPVRGPRARPGSYVVRVDWITAPWSEVPTPRACTESDAFRIE